MSIDGISSASTATYTQNVLASPSYQITAFPAAQAGFYTLSSTPAGMAFDTTTGVLSGTPSVSGIYNLTIGARTSAPAVATYSQALTLTVSPVPGNPTISTSLPASPTNAGDVNTSFNGLAYRVNVSNPSLTSMGYGANGLPAGLSIDTGTGLITGTPTESGDFVLSLTGRNGNGFGTALPWTMRVNPTLAPSFTSSASVSGTVNQGPFSYSPVAGPLPILSFSVAGGSSLPPGLTMPNTTTGVITGTPTSSGTFTTNLTATNPAGTSTPFTLTFTIAPTASPVVSVPLVAVPTATATLGGGAISAIQIAATNPTITGYSATGLPNGLTVNGSGQIVGTPLESGDFVVVARATNVIGTGSAAPVTIRINPNQVPTINNASNTVTTNANQVYTGALTLTATNLPILNFAVASGSALPTGLALGATSGVITGTPTTSGQVVTSFVATNAAGTGAPFAVTFNIVPTSRPTVSAPLVAAPTATGRIGNGPITAIQISATNPPILAYGATGLPTGLSVNGSGQIVGTPTVSGDFSVAVNATNAFGQGTAAPVTIRIDPNVAPTFTSSATVTGTVNTGPLTYTPVAGPLPILSFAVANGSTLPPGLTMPSAANGVITGTPTASGSFGTNITATNAAGTSAPFTLTLTIAPTAVPVVSAPLVAAPTVTATASVGPITPIQISGTNPTITGYSATGLPTGLSVNGAGQIVGTPLQSGDFPVVVMATNVVGTGSAAPVTIRINPSQVPVINSQATKSGSAGQALTTYTITATQPPLLSFAVASGSALPAGLALDTTTGAITGTPTTSGTTNTSLLATNAAGASASFVVTFTIAPTLVPVVTASLPASPTVAGTVGTGITTIQVNATNVPITSYSATGLPGGLSVHPTTGVLSGVPTASGDFVVVLSAANAVGTGSMAPVTIRINPNTGPVINSSNTATGVTNTAMTPYQITATNGPIVSYAVVAPSTLPAGLSLNTGTGAITGTPTISGSFTTNLAAANVAGTSASFALTFTISPSMVPAITSPTFATVAAGTAITPIQVVATNLPIVSYSATGLPAGLVINPTTGVITGTPTTPGVSSATLGASNVVGPGSRVVPFTIGIPAPTACAMSVPLNTPTTFDLASCLFSGFAPTGVTIIATPAHGTAVVNGTRVTFTPVNNYFGGDSFSFVATGLGGTSPQGTVSVTVTGRPDPMKDANVVAFIGAQAETAQRFSRAQVSNVQRRMEALHRGAGTVAPAGGALQQAATPVVPGLGGSSAGAFAGAVAAATQATTWPVAPSARTGSASSASSHGTRAALPAAAAVSVPVQAANSVTTGSALALPRNFGVERLGQQGTAGSVGGTADQGAVALREADALNAIASGTGLRSLPFSEGVISLIKSRSLDLAGVASGLGLNTVPDATGKTSYWMEGVASFGTRDASGGVSSSEFSSNGISVGVDKRINKDLAVGVGLGYARDKATIGTDGSVNRSKGYSLSVYGSYQIQDNTYIDGLLGVGSLDFDTTRFVAPMNDFALGQRGGTQLFGSLTGGYEWRSRDLLVSPYGRIDFSTDRLRTSTETGAGAFALTYFSQTSTSVQGALGVRAESAHATSFGYAVPKVRAELRHEFKGAGEAFVGYADQPGGPRFGLLSAGGARNSLVVGLGSEFLMRDGLTLSMEYQLSHSFSNDSSYAVRLRLSKDFEARGLPKLRLAEPEGDEEPANLQFDAGYNTDSNVTRAKAGPDRLNDDSFSANVGKTWIFGLTEQSRVLLTGTAGGEKFHRFNGLSRASVGLEAGYQYRASSEFGEPTFGAFAKFNGEEFESSLRDGYRLGTGVSVQLPLSDRIGLFGAAAFNLRNAASDVFSTRERSLRANLDYALSERSTIYLGSEWRFGDIVSTGQASLENVTISKVFAQDDAYAGGQLFSYKVDGRTNLLTLGYNLSFGSKDSIDFSWRHVRSTPGLRPAFVTSPRSYKANQLSAVYLLRF